MPLFLSDQDLAEFRALLDDTLMRPKDAVRLVGFFEGKHVRQQAQAAQAAAQPPAPAPELQPASPPKHANGASHPEADAHA